MLFKNSAWKKHTNRGSDSPTTKGKATIHLNNLLKQTWPRIQFRNGLIINNRSN